MRDYYGPFAERSLEADAEVVRAGGRLRRADAALATALKAGAFAGAARDAVAAAERALLAAARTPG